MSVVKKYVTVIMFLAHPAVISRASMANHFFNAVRKPCGSGSFKLGVEPRGIFHAASALRVAGRHNHPETVLLRVWDMAVRPR